MNKRNFWVKPVKPIYMGGFKCLRGRLNMNGGFKGLPAEYELGLFGKNGEIWIKNENTYSALIGPILTQRKALRLIKDDHFSANKGGDLIVHFDKALLPAFVELLKVPSQPGRQLNYVDRYLEQQ